MSLVNLENSYSNNTCISSVQIILKTEVTFLSSYFQWYVKGLSFCSILFNSLTH